MFYRKNRKIILPTIVFPIFIIIWEAYIKIFHVSSYVLPSPWALFSSFIELFAEGTIWPHIAVTMQEIFIGTLVGLVIGLVLGYIMAKIKILERLIMPFVIIIQTAPKISLAPLFILWMGLGIESKAALVILVVSFPVMINEVSAIRSIDPNVYNLMKILKANPWQRFVKIELPYSCLLYTSVKETGKKTAPIGVFDSGVGGLTVMREISRNLPCENIIYFGDTARVPYGSKSQNNVIRFSRQIIRFLENKQVKAIVIACNTASALALDTVQQEFDLPILGVVIPGARAAVEATHNRKVGVEMCIRDSCIAGWNRDDNEGSSQAEPPFLIL